MTPSLMTSTASSNWQIPSADCALHLEHELDGAKPSWTTEEGWPVVHPCVRRTAGPRSVDHRPARRRSGPLSLDPENGMVGGDAAQRLVGRVRIDPLEKDTNFEGPAAQIGPQQLDLERLVVRNFDQLDR